jgi:glycosyltransferase involved in cell wall biosynthesis
LACADLFVFSTHSDTFGAALTEAMAAELPVLASCHAAATADFVRDGINGWVYDPWDPEAGARRVLEFLALSPPQRRSMGLAAYRAVRETDTVAAAERMMRFLHTVTGRDRLVSGTARLAAAASPEVSRVPVLIVGPTPPPYHGVAVAVRTLLDSPLNETFDLHHLDLADRRGIAYVNRPDWHDVMLFVRQWTRLLWLLMRHRPVIAYFVLSQTTIGVLRDSLLVWPAILGGAAVVGHLHGGALQDWYRSCRWPMQRYARLFLSRLSRAIVLGESLRSQFAELVPPERIAVVPNGVPDHGIGCTSRPRLRRRWRVLYLNTLNKMKGALVLLEAIALLRPTRQDVEFVFAGPWSHEAHRLEAEAIIVREDLAAMVSFTGQVAGGEKTALLRESDLFVFPGIQPEGQPLVVLEAMAAGLPIVFTAQGCLSETLSDGQEGMAVPPGDAAALAAAIDRLLSRPSEMARLGANARDRFERDYTVARHVERLTAVFRDLLARSPARTTATVSTVGEVRLSQSGKK